MKHINNLFFLIFILTIIFCTNGVFAKTKGEMTLTTKEVKMQQPKMSDKKMTLTTKNIEFLQPVVAQSSTGVKLTTKSITLAPAQTNNNVSQEEKQETLKTILAQAENISQKKEGQNSALEKTPEKLPEAELKAETESKAEPKAEPKAEIDKKDFVFDPVLEGNYVAHDYKIKNTGKGVLKISKVKTG